MCSFVSGLLDNLMRNFLSAQFQDTILKVLQTPWPYIHVHMAIFELRELKILKEEILFREENLSGFEELQGSAGY